jgi:hypothetical protein
VKQVKPQDSGGRSGYACSTDDPPLLEGEQPMNPFESALRSVGDTLRKIFDRRRPRRSTWKATLADVRRAEEHHFPTT